MNGRDSDGFSAIWSTWFVDRLFIVDELARKQRPETSGEGSGGSATIPSRTDCDETDRAGTHVRESVGEDGLRTSTNEREIRRRQAAQNERQINV